MKKSLADGIEQYLKALLARSDNHQIEMQRAELAETFSCVPSQVTYVLSTRFTAKDGYCIESRRGGQGYIRITEIEHDDKYTNSRSSLANLIQELKMGKILSDQETEMLKHIIRNLSTSLPSEYGICVNESITLALRQFFKL